MLLIPPPQPIYPSSQHGPHSRLHFQVYRQLLPSNQSRLHHRGHKGRGGAADAHWNQLAPVTHTLTHTHTQHTLQHVLLVLDLSQFNALFVKILLQAISDIAQGQGGTVVEYVCSQNKEHGSSLLAVCECM